MAHTGHGILDIIEGVGMIGAAVVADIATLGGASLATIFPLVTGGASMIAVGIGTLAQSDPVKNQSTTERNPISPWRVGYGRTAPKNDVIYMHQWGKNGQMLDMVMVIYDHPCESIDSLWFNQERVQIDTAAIPTSASAGYTIPYPATGAGTSFSPNGAKGNPIWTTATSITALNDVVTIVTPQDIPYLTSGDPILIRNHGGGSYNATFTVSQIISRVPSGGTNILTFTILNGGVMPSSIEVSPCWVSYGRTVYFEPMLGNQLLGQTFVGMTAGTPWQGTGGLVTPLSVGDAGSDDNFPSQSNPWTADCTCMGKTLVFLRINVGNTDYYPGSGLPMISFRVHGKNNIYDPRIGPCTGVKATAMTATGSGYETAALYAAYDILTLVQGSASGGQVAVTGVDGSGHITSWVVVAPGTGYALGAATTTGLYGSGATFNITALTGATGCNVYTTNPVLCIADYLTDLTWGFKVPWSDIPLAGIISAANVCDTATALAIGGTEPLYACNGQFEATALRGQVLQDLLSSCAGRITPEAPYSIQPGYWTGATVSGTTDLQAIAAGPYTWKGPTTHELFNACKGTYVSPDNKWQGTDYPYYAQDSMHGYSGPSAFQGDANYAADGERRFLELNLPFTISSRQAQYTAKVELLRRRWANLGTPPVPGTASGFGGTGAFSCNMAAYQFAPLDVFAASVGFLGISAQLMEVKLARLKSEVRDKALLLGVDLELQLTDSSIYTWTTAEELTPQGYVQTSYPVGQAAETTPWPWSPGYVAPLAGDAIFPQGATGPASFGLQPNYALDTNGNGVVSIQIKGTPPASKLNTAIANPAFTVASYTTGGYLPAGTWAVSLAARDAGSGDFGYSDFEAVQIVATFGYPVTNSIVITPDWGPGDDGGDIYMAQWTQDGYVWHRQHTMLATDTSYTITGFDESTPGGPDPMFDHLGVVPWPVVHSGRWAQQVQSVTATTVTVAGAGMTTNMWAGSVLSLLGKINPGVEVPILNMPVASNTASSGGLFAMTIGTNSASVQLPDLTTLLSVGDLVVMRDSPTFTATGFTDALICNPYYPTGADPAVEGNVEPGHVAVVMSGPDAGDMQPISGVAESSPGSGLYDAFTLSGQWAITPNAGDLVVVCAPAANPEVPTAPLPIPNTTMGGGVVATLATPNLAGQTWLFLARTEDAAGNHGPDSLAPMRDLYQFGAGGMSLTVA